jgi:hypothetical protein
MTEPTEDLWWEVTTTTGLTLVLPAPLPRISLVMAMDGKHVEITSPHTGQVFLLAMKDILLIRQFSKPTVDKDRLERSKARALGIGSASSADDSPAPDSPPAPSPKRSGRSTGGPTKPPIH